METLSLEQVRRLVLRGQLLDGRTRLTPGKEGAAQVVEALGYVQIDSLSVVQRAHHHVLWTRVPGYGPAMLEELQDTDRRVFEYWAHARSYLPAEDFRYYLTRMRAFEASRSPWARVRLEQTAHLLEEVLARVQQEGPLQAADFPAPAGAKGGNPYRFALEVLHFQGRLLVSRRRGTKKWYDLTGRVLPGVEADRPPDEEEVGRFQVRRGLAALGPAREEELAAFLQPTAARDAHYRGVDPEVIARTLESLREAGEAAQVGVEGQEEAYYVWAEDLETGLGSARGPGSVFLLSPFDNLLTQRDRVRRLFHFDYTLEAYLPASRRTFGYFALPILWEGSLVGRLDPKADRQRKVLQVRTLALEPEFEPREPFLPMLARSLAAFAEFNGCRQVQLEHSSPPGIRKELARLLADG